MVKIPLRLIHSSSDFGLDEILENREPLILWFQDGKFIFQGKSVILEQLRIQRINSYPAFIFVTDKREYASYVNNYGKQFHQAKL